jgi:hypothetical protein
MKLKSKLLTYTAVAALSVNVALAAVDPQALGRAYLAEGYTYVEVKVGPTQTKLEGVKGDRKVEVIYDNASGAVIKQEFEDADDDYRGRTGIEIEDSRRDFVRDDRDDDERDDHDEDDEGNDRDDDEDDDEDDDDEDDEDDDEEDDEDDDKGSDRDDDEDDESDRGRGRDRGDDDEDGKDGDDD